MADSACADAQRYRRLHRLIGQIPAGQGEDRRHDDLRLQVTCATHGGPNAVACRSDDHIGSVGPWQEQSSVGPIAYFIWGRRPSAQEPPLAA